MKKTVWLLPFFLLIFSGCQDKEARAELEALKAQTELEEQNKELVQSYIDAWNGFDLSVLGEYLGESFKVYIPSNSGEPMNMDQFREWVGGIFTGFPDSHYDILDIFCEGDQVCVRWVYSATHQGDFGGIPPTGLQVTGSAIEIFSVENGKIVEERSEMDALGLMQQLGLALTADNSSD